MDDFEQWFQSKIGLGVRPFRGLITIGHEINHVTGSRSRYARVVLSAFPSDEFNFISEASWPPSVNYDPIVLRAIMDVLMGQPGPPYGVSFVLKEAGWDEINSDEATFYAAARAAAIAVLKRTGNWVE